MANLVVVEIRIAEYIAFSGISFMGLKVDEFQLAVVKGVRKSYRPPRVSRSEKRVGGMMTVSPFAELQALTFDKTQRSDNFYDFLTSGTILKQGLKLLLIALLKDSGISGQ